MRVVEETAFEPVARRCAAVSCADVTVALTPNELSAALAVGQTELRQALGADSRVVLDLAKRRLRCTVTSATAMRLFGEAEPDDLGLAVMRELRPLLG